MMMMIRATTEEMPAIRGTANREDDSSWYKYEALSVSILVVLVVKLSAVVSGGGALVEDAGVDVQLTIKQMMTSYSIKCSLFFYHTLGPWGG